MFVTETNAMHFLTKTYLVEAVHCSPPLEVSVQYFPVQVLKAHFFVSLLISIWKVSWSLSSSWLADRSIPERGGWAEHYKFHYQDNQK